MKNGLTEKHAELRELEDEVKELNKTLALWEAQLTNEDIIKEIA
jgi:hypothetical protein